MNEEAEFCTVDCCDCGIQFKFNKKIEEMWRKSGKTFHCPNGHSLHWDPKKTDTPEQAEIKKLKAEVKELKEKLTATETKLADSEKNLEAEKKRAEELATELEIWRPTTDDKKAG